MGTKIIKEKTDLKKYKPVGVVRAIDNLGRVTISSEARQCMKIGNGDLLEQTLCRDENGEYVMIIRKYRGD